MSIPLSTCTIVQISNSSIIMYTVNCKSLLKIKNVLKTHVLYNSYINFTYYIKYNYFNKNKKV